MPDTGLYPAGHPAVAGVQLVFELADVHFTTGAGAAPFKHFTVRFFAARLVVDSTRPVDNTFTFTDHPFNTPTAPPAAQSATTNRHVPFGFFPTQVAKSPLTVFVSVG